MASIKQVKANQQNSLKSTGPKSKEGKVAVSKNRLKHGIMSRRLILDGESESEFRGLVEVLESDFEVSASMERLLIENIAIAIWRKQRLIRYETGITEKGRSEESLMFSSIAAKGVSEDRVLDSLTLPDHKLELLIKYHASLDHQLYRAIKALMDLQQHRRMV